MTGSADGPETTVQRAGATVFPGFQLRRVVRTGSTQDVVRAAARSGAAEGFCCVADEQTAGRGRAGRTWSAPPRSALLTSLLLRRRAAVNAGIPFAAGLAILEALRRSCGVMALLKWPNDVLAGGAKLAGILAEGSAAGGTVLGIGVNLTVPSFPPDIEGVSLHQLTATPPSWAELLVAFLEALGERLAALEGAGIPALREEWTAHAQGIGEPVRADAGGHILTGIAAGIDLDGALLIDTAKGRQRLVAGDVHLLRPQ
jgi:BirA family biotin operon repressor/biotin-[acetyl-CoA-carboxylase] ligase